MSNKISYSITESKSRTETPIERTRIKGRDGERSTETCSINKEDMG